MGTATAAPTDAPPAEALELHESVSVIEESAANGAIQPDGTILMHVIRPTVGRGRGSHLYTPEMLRENAEKFVGWKMYLNHLSPAAKKAAGGLPREWEDFGGQIKEAWWDDTVPADEARGIERGAVVAKAKPFGLARQIAEEFPEVLEASISTTATGVRQANRGGKRVWVVEGIADRGSVDFVTEAGAGGKVIAAIQEAAITEESAMSEALETFTDTEFIEHLRDKRPALVEAIKAGESGGESGDATPKEDKVEITPEALTEALQSEAGREVIDRLVEERTDQIVESKVEQRLDGERDSIRLQARADFDRELELRDLRDHAHKQIAEARLPKSLKDRIEREFVLTEFGPSAKLDQFAEVDGEGKTVKTAQVKVEEAVQAEVEEARAVVAEVRPTKVRGQGRSVTVEEAESGGKPPDKDDKTESDDKGGRYAGTAASALLQEARLDPATAWDGV